MYALSERQWELELSEELTALLLHYTRRVPPFAPDATLLAEESLAARRRTAKELRALRAPSTTEWLAALHEAHARLAALHQHSAVPTTARPALAHAQALLAPWLAAHPPLDPSHGHYPGQADMSGV